MPNRRVIPFVFFALTVFGLLGACSSLGFYAPCKTPGNLIPKQLFGAWRLTYSPDHWVSDPVEGSLVVSGTTTYLVAPAATPMSLAACERIVPLESNVAWERCSLLRGRAYQMEGQETIMLNQDGTYRQTFASSTYSYTSPLYRWEFIGDTPDGPKLRMNNMKYFAEGVPQGNSAVFIMLQPQVVDSLRVQKYEQAHPQENWVISVAYPDDGFIYLYPRLCDGRLSLAQMVFRPSDADNQVVTNPVFRR